MGMADYSVTIWGEKNTPEGFLAFKKKIKKSAEIFVELSNSLGEEGNGVYIRFYELDISERDFKFGGRYLMSPRSKWLVEFTLRDQAGIELVVDGTEGMTYYVLEDSGTEAVLFEGYGEEWLKAYEAGELEKYENADLSTMYLYELEKTYDTDMETI